MLRYKSHKTSVSAAQLSQAGKNLGFALMQSFFINVLHNFKSAQFFLAHRNKSIQRLDAIIKTAGLSDSELGKWCREYGLHTHHLTEWRELALEATSDRSNQNQKTYREKNKKLRDENKSLKKDLSRKEKALAEGGYLSLL